MRVKRKMSGAAVRAAGSAAILLAVLAFLAAVPSLTAGAPKAKPKTPATQPAQETPPAPSTHVVRMAPFKIEVDTKGVFEARNMTEVVFRPEVWADLIVRSAVEPGTAVKKGDVLIELEADKLDEAIEDLQAGEKLAETAIRLLEADAAALGKSVPLDLAAAERGKRIADEDLKLYLQTDRPLAVKTAKASVKRAEDYLAYNREELRQLEKMYKADDLTEETEEIVLKRQRDAVERAEFALEATRIEADQKLNVDLPRRDVTIKEQAQRQAIALEKTKVAAPAALAKMRLDLARQKQARQKSAEKLHKLQADRKAMTVRAGVGGIVYYGECVQGAWPKLSRGLKQGTKLLPHEVVMTIVQPGDMIVRATVAEKDLRHLKAGVEGTVTPVSYPDLKLKARVERVSPIPVGEGTFAICLSVELPEDAPALVPGMNCTAKLVPYKKVLALAVPAAALFPDEPDETRSVVYVRGKDGHAEKRPVKVVRRGDRMVEVLGPLADGDVVLLQKPKEEDK